MKLLLLQSLGLLFITGCIVNSGSSTSPQGPGTNTAGTNPAGAGNGSADSPAPTIHGMLSDWQPFPGANVRIELSLSDSQSFTTAATTTFDARGGFSITLPARAELAPHLSNKMLRLECGTFAIAPADARLAVAVFAIYNAAGNRTGILLNGDAPAGLGEAPRGNRHGLVFADVATKMSGACTAPSDEKYDVALVPGWNVMAFASAPPAATSVTTGTLPFPGKWYYVSQPGPGLVK